MSANNKNNAKGLGFDLACVWGFVFGWLPSVSGLTSSVLSVMVLGCQMVGVKYERYQSQFMSIIQRQIIIKVINCPCECNSVASAKR